MVFHLTVCIVHLAYLRGVSSDANHIVIKLGHVGGCRKPRARDRLERVQKEIIQNLQHVVGQPGHPDGDHWLVIALEQHLGIHMAWK